MPATNAEPTTRATDYETDVDARSYRRLYHEESAIAFSAIDCVLNGERGVYASRLTTGARAYAQLRDAGLRDMRDLTGAQRQALLDTNVAEAVAFARRVREQLGGREPVVTPGPFAAPGWTQAEYLTFWETLIRTRARAIAVNRGWEYSNGCTFEVAVAAEHGAPLLDAELRPLVPADGVARIEHAIDDLAAQGFDVHRLRLNLDRLRRAG